MTANASKRAFKTSGYLQLVLLGREEHAYELERAAREGWGVAWRRRYRRGPGPDDREPGLRHDLARRLSGLRSRTGGGLLDATESLHVATGVVNICMSDPAELADSYHRIETKYPGRLLLGIGSGHREATPGRVRPVDAIASYLDVLDERDVPVEARVLSALGPRMLALAATRSACGVSEVGERVTSADGRSAACRG